jgi:hypothetical protein
MKIELTLRFVAFSLFTFVCYLAFSLLAEKERENYELDVYDYENKYKTTLESEGGSKYPEVLCSFAGTAGQVEFDDKYNKDDQL